MFPTDFESPFLRPPAVPGAARAAAITATAGAALAWPLAVIDLPQSGPMCQQAVCLTAPFANAVYAPIDYLWMYPAAVLVVSFAVLLIVLEPLAPPQRWVAARLASRAASAAAVVLISAFALQLFVVQPSILLNEQASVAMWSQFNPHGGFIALENLGYLLMCLSLLAVSRLVPGRQGLRRLVRLTGAGLGGLGVFALPLQAALFGAQLDYRYEVAAISLTWTAIVVVSIPLVVCINSDLRTAAQAQPSVQLGELAAAD